MMLIIKGSPGIAQNVSNHIKTNTFPASILTQSLYLIFYIQSKHKSTKQLEKHKSVIKFRNKKGERVCARTRERERERERERKSKINHAHNMKLSSSSPLRS